MVRLSVAREALPSLVRSSPFVAVFVGGTSGICEYSLRQLAKLYGSQGNLRAYIVGRNAQAAERIIADCARDCPQGRFVFVKANDLSLLHDVDRVCAEISKLEGDQHADDEKPWLDLLMMSQACSVFQKQTDTAEGIDFLMSLLYYSRMRFITKLLPLLQQSKPHASVISIYAAGTEDKLIMDDLPLQKAGNYGYFQARSHIAFLKTIFMEKIAQEHSGVLSLKHVFPGLIFTPAFRDTGNPLWFKVTSTILHPLLKLKALSPDEVGDRMLYLATSRFPPLAASPHDQSSSISTKELSATAIATTGVTGGGAYSVNDKGETIPPPKAYSKISKTELSQAGWDHTMKVFSEIESQGRYSGASNQPK